MVKQCDLMQWFTDRQFHFAELALTGIDNQPVLAINSPEMADEEICLFHRGISNGDHYFERLDEWVRRCTAERKALPVVRFADGEYAFYNLDMHCNGLYRQAESVAAIQRAIPLHQEALQYLTTTGVMAPLIFPGNLARKPEGFFYFLKKLKESSSAVTFMTFLFENGIELNSRCYVPFYVVYAWLSSMVFARLVDRKRVCILNSEWSEEACARWFSNLSSRPDFAFVRIPAEYVATRWEAMREGVLNRIPADADICLVGAGIGALPICVDVARRFSVPAIDAGHVLNMMNDRVDKSNGARLYTLWKNRG
ncbi:MAG: hypothetical protein V1766_14220 [Pseudomonadota bacterium]